MNIVVRKRRSSDVTAPVISAIVGVPGNITWTTDEPATSQVDYGAGGSGYASVITTDAPVAWWRLGEPSGTSAADEIGTATGTYQNTPTLGATSLLSGDSDTAVTFDRASTEYVSMSTGIPAGSANGASIEAWVKLASRTAGNYYFIARWSGRHAMYYREYDASTFLLYWEFNDGSAREVWTGWAPTIGQTYHVVVTHDYTTDTVTYYIDGTAIDTDDTAAYTPLAPAAATASYIGTYAGGSHYWDGTIDEVSFWDRALSSTEVADHYAAAAIPGGGGYLYTVSDATLVTAHDLSDAGFTDGTKYVVKSADIKGNLATSAEQTVTEGSPGGTLQDRIDAASPGGTINLGNEVFTAAATVDKALTINGGVLNVAASTTALTITANSVTIDGMAITGHQHANYVSSERGIHCATAIANLVIKNCTIRNFGNTGIWLDRVTSGLDINRNVVDDMCYTGMMICSCSSGTIDYNTVRRIGESWFTGGNRTGIDNNAYGIALTHQLVNTVTSNVTVTHNTIEDVPSWHGLDTHSGADCTFSYNTIRRCSRPVFITTTVANALRVAVDNNRIEGPGTVANNLTAITFAYTTSCSATNNAISSLYPSANQFTGGGNVKVYDYTLASTGLVVSGNTLI